MLHQQEISLIVSKGFSFEPKVVRLADPRPSHAVFRRRMSGYVREFD